MARALKFFFNLKKNSCFQLHSMVNFFATFDDEKILNSKSCKKSILRDYSTENPGRR